MLEDNKGACALSNCSIIYFILKYWNELYCVWQSGPEVRVHTVQNTKYSVAMVFAMNLGQGWVNQTYYYHHSHWGQIIHWSRVGVQPKLYVIRHHKQT